MIKKIMVTGGHGLSSGTTNDPGAVAPDGTTERWAIEQVGQYIKDDNLISTVGLHKKVNYLNKIAEVNRQCNELSLDSTNSVLCDLHCDWRDAKGGIMCYYYSGSDKSKALADFVGQYVASKTNQKWKGSKPDTACRYGRIGTIKETIPLAFLIEMAVMGDDPLTPLNELAFIKSKAGQQALAKHIIDGIKIHCGIAETTEMVSDWARLSWDKAVKAGILTKLPQETITAERLAVILDRLGLLK